MCGVFGVIRPSGIVQADRQTQASLSAKLTHRGPDGSGEMEVRTAILGMHRLSIVDLARGWQPFWSEDGTIGVLGNGEIYNAGELREGLRRRGHSLTSQSDIELVAHLYEEVGLQSIQLLRGMFALVILDKDNSEVVLVRDRLGEKPLLYVESGGWLCFASEQHALVAAGVVPPVINQAVLPTYLLHGFVPEPLSLLEGVRKVPAGHALRISLRDGSTQLFKYWDCLSFAGDCNLSTDDLADGITDAVNATLVSDVPVGIALSGGLDSSIIAATAAQTRDDLMAFTVGYSEQGFDESEAARSFADELGIPCQVVTLDTSSVAHNFAKVCAVRDEPISDIAGPALAAIPQAAQMQGVKVLMTGVGGDELFWGYEWIRHLAAWSTQHLSTAKAPSRLQRLGLTSAPSTTQGLAAWMASAFGVRTQHDLVAFMKRWSTGSSVPLPFYEFQYGYRKIIRQIASLVSVDSNFPIPEFMGSIEAEAKGAEYTVASNDTYLRVNSLTQMDRLSMHYSVESRTPFADYRLVELIMSGRLDESQVFEPTKSRQRAVAARVLPKYVVDREKRGFTPPVRNWARAIWSHNAPALDAEALSTHCAMDIECARRIMRSPVDRIGRVDQMALRLLTLELWLRSLEKT